jgi:hypothetical protein
MMSVLSSITVRIFFMSSVLMFFAFGERECLRFLVVGELSEPVVSSDVDVDGLMLLAVEVEDEAKKSEQLRHILILFTNMGIIFDTYNAYVRKCFRQGFRTVRRDDEPVPDQG